jgi:hypothetical protein
MKAIIAVVIFLFGLGPLFSPVYAGNPAQIDWMVKFLLDEETTPFFPDTVRHTFVNAAMIHISGRCKFAAQDMDTAYIPGTGNNSSIVWNKNPGVKSVTEILGIKLKGQDRGLMRVEKKHLGLDRIRTDLGAEFWYYTSFNYPRPTIGIYNMVTESTAVEIYYSGIADWDSCRAFKHYFHNEAALYALYLAKLRRGETEVANFIRQIAENEIMDLKVILESRQPDITVKQEVLPR